MSFENRMLAGVGLHAANFHDKQVSGCGENRVRLSSLNCPACLGILNAEGSVKLRSQFAL